LSLKANASCPIGFSGEYFYGLGTILSAPIICGFGVLTTVLVKDSRPVPKEYVFFFIWLVNVDVVAFGVNKLFILYVSGEGFFSIL